jgi:glucose/arabinose dehydrogenase
MSKGLATKSRIAHHSCEELECGHQMSMNTTLRRPKPRFILSLVYALILLSAALSTSVHPAAAQTVPEHFSVETIHTSAAFKATGFALLPDGRFLVLDHQSGDVNLIVDASPGATTIATIPDLAASSERGLLGVAVDPDYPDENYVYLYYTSSSGVNRVSRFPVGGDLSNPFSLDLSLDLSGEEVLLQMQDDSPLHNAGTLRFGGDKTLYISHGDDVKFKFWEDDELYLQDLTNLYGKILRINRDGSVPDGNPVFPSEPAQKRSEIFAIGLRNPFRFSIDPMTDRLFIGDVGTDLREEFNLSEGGENFGYPRHEGTVFFYDDADLTAPEPTPPIYDYERSSNRSAIALVTYRPQAATAIHNFPAEYDGVHFHADFFQNELRYLQPNGDGGWESVLFGTGFPQLVDGALGPEGEIYLLSYRGQLRRIIYTTPPVDAEDQPIATNLELHQNHPNPFHEETLITYELADSGPVRLDVFDMLGRRVATPVDLWQNAGQYSVRLDVDGLAAGTYIYRLQTDSSSKTRKMVRAANY